MDVQRIWVPAGHRSLGQHSACIEDDDVSRECEINEMSVRLL